MLVFLRVPSLVLWLLMGNPICLCMLLISKSLLRLLIYLLKSHRQRSAVFLILAHFFFFNLVDISISLTHGYNFPSCTAQIQTIFLTLSISSSTHSFPPYTIMSSSRWNTFPRYFYTITTVIFLFYYYLSPFISLVASFCSRINPDFLKFLSMPILTLMISHSTFWPHSTSLNILLLLQIPLPPTITIQVCVRSLWLTSWCSFWNLAIILQCYAVWEIVPNSRVGP